MNATSAVVGWRSAAAACAAVLAIALVWPQWPGDFQIVRERWRPSDAYLLDRNGELLDQVRIDHGARRGEWVSLDAISPAFLGAIVAGEDRRYWTHHGVDALALASATRDRFLGRKSRGASTITMQLTDLLRDGPRRQAPRKSVLQKLRQMSSAWALESRWSKSETLEAYVNLVGFRGEVQGIGAAATVIAGKSPASLSEADSLVLAALVPNPGAARERVADRACARATSVAAPVACADIRATAVELLGHRAERAEQLHLAPQLARNLLLRAGQRERTTLDLRTQLVARDALIHHLSNLADRNVRDGAAIVVDNASGDALAYVGSAGPSSTASEVDGVRARRQAGSTLKPFLYGLALEERLLTAASLLDDSPLILDTASGVYIPQDYDRDFKGWVSVRTALGSSLNVPAVRTLVLAGVDRFRDRLWALGYRGITESGDYYGYSLALGSAEVSLWEQAQAYRTLARLGLSTPLRLRTDDPNGAPSAVLPADVSFIVADILSDRTARIVTFGLDNYLNTSYWAAAKTGTSKDMRDNWCIGFSRRFTVAVWVGNFEGDSMHDVSGVTGAAPVWREIMDALHAGTGSLPPEPPPGLRRVLAEYSPALEGRRQEWFLPNTENPKVSLVPPGHGNVRISSPGNGMVIAIDPDIPSQRQRVTIAAQGGTSSMVFRLDDRELGPADDRLLWKPEYGAHSLVLADGSGRTLDRILFTVR